MVKRWSERPKGAGAKPRREEEKVEDFVKVDSAEAAAAAGR